MPAVCDPPLKFAALRLIFPFAKHIRTSRAGQLEQADRRHPRGNFGVGQNRDRPRRGVVRRRTEPHQYQSDPFPGGPHLQHSEGGPLGDLGNGEGAVLTDDVRRKPYSVMLLDEVEKPHRRARDFLPSRQQILHGRRRRVFHRLLDYADPVKTNTGTKWIASLCKDSELIPEPDAIAKSLLKIFPPALLGRLVTIPYYPLSDEMLGQIVKLQLNRIKKRVEARYKIPFEYTDDVVKLVVSRCTESESGGRMIDAILTNTMLPDISREFLLRMMEGKPVVGVNVGVNNLQFEYSFG
jgi:type VI secretion system protein VasG